MKDYVGQSLDETNDKIKSIQEDIIDKQNNAFLYNVKSFEQRIFTTLIAFGMIYQLIDLWHTNETAFFCGFFLILYTIRQGRAMT